MGMTTFLHFAAGVSTEIMAGCPQSERIKYAGIGATVCFTTLMAALSALFAFQLILESIGLSILLSLIWAGLIFNLDRFLISSFRKKGEPVREIFQALPRLVLAVFIALVISRPLELELFRTEINYRLAEQKMARLSAIEKGFVTRVAGLDRREQVVQARLDRSLSLKEAYYDQYRCECDGTCGTGRRGRGSECMRKQKKYEAFSAEHRALEQDAARKYAVIRTERLQLDQNRKQDRATVEKYFSRGLHARLEALGDLAGTTSLAILFLFIFLETAPVLSKLLAPVGPYDLLLQGKELPYRVAWYGQVREERKSDGQMPILQAKPPPPEVRKRPAAHPPGLEVQASENKEEELRELQIYLLKKKLKGPFQV